MNLFDRLRRQRKPVDPQAETQRKVERDLRRRMRKEARQARWMYLSSLFGNLAGTIFGTKKIGLAIMIVIVILGLVIIWKHIL